MAKDWKTKNQFIPHVTLLGGIECSLVKAQEITQELVQSRALKPVDILLDKVGYGEIFHQTVFIHVSKTEELVKQHDVVLDAFGMEASVSGYMPHMSLIYSHMGIDDRRLLAEEEEERLLKSCSKDARNMRQVKRLELWYTPVADTSLQSWRCIESYELL